MSNGEGENHKSQNDLWATDSISIGGCNTNITSFGSINNVPVLEVEDKGPAESSNQKEKSHISVFYTDWVPGNDTDNQPTSAKLVPYPADNYQPSFGGERPRYFQVHKGHRPGLGLSIDDLVKSSKRPKSKPKKRKHSLNLLTDESLAKKVKVTPEKPASQIVHELDCNLQYIFNEVKIDGSKAASTYTCTIKFPSANGVDFVGEGRSKKLAKNDAAEKILVSFGVTLPPKEVSDADPEMPEKDQKNHSNFQNSTHSTSVVSAFPLDSVEVDFASDDLMEGNFVTSHPTDAAQMLSQPMVDSSLLQRLRNIPNFEDNVILALNTMFPGSVEYELMSEVGPPHDKVFTVKITLNGQDFIGEAGSKKKAKAKAAKMALLMLLGTNSYNYLVSCSPNKPDQAQMPLSDAINFDNMLRRCKKSKSRKSNKIEQGEPADMDDSNDIDDCGEYDLNFSDHVCNLVMEKFNELISAESNYYAYKVLAGAVLSRRSPIIYNSEVIAVATGTKCVEGDCMSQDGLSINDCHAEILVTRCVRDYLYSQIDLLENAKSEAELEECVLEKIASPAFGETRKYTLKPDINFHLYISTSPCGDARIFSPKGLELEDGPPSPADVEDTHPHKMNRGVLRSKIEAGEGTIPSANLYNGPQTWDSIVSGNALYTMSCSDKVCRWNILGLQGALLYNLLGTIYYSSITLGSLHHPVHFKRAIYGRVEAIDSRLPSPFFVKKPKLMMVSKAEKRRVKKSPNHAVCWTKNWSTPEVLAASKGRCEPGGVASRLTKRVAFSRFLNLYKNDSGKRDNYADLTYRDAKNLALDYQKAKEEFISFFQESKLGPWIGKPLEQDLFRIK